MTTNATSSHVNMSTLLGSVQEFMGHVQTLEAEQSTISVIESDASLNIAGVQKSNSDELIKDSNKLMIASIVTTASAALLGASQLFSQGSQFGASTVKLIGSGANTVGQGLTAKYSQDLGDHQVEQANLSTCDDQAQSVAKQGSDSASQIATQVQDVSRAILTLISNHQQASSV